jgi:hypothetical protein
MSWEIEYFERPTGEQPAEVFEGDLPPRLLARLIRFAEAAAESRGTIGGGYWEPCHDWPGLFEVRAELARDLGRYYATVDGNRMVLLDGFQKRRGEPTPQAVFATAENYRQGYLATRRVSPERP